ncbi:hypothetical protein EYF80_015110 [Liparis tanakae]|uniref:Secreted protein n=1 Tax=Liparis tanakae TaxID=230148 RepID=A0A4Z2IBT8_9TELE|nr:hypothetical protein EYF80_015110 [Liparis tanakae]
MYTLLLLLLLLLLLPLPHNATCYTQHLHLQGSTSSHTHGCGPTEACGQRHCAVCIRLQMRVLFRGYLFRFCFYFTLEISQIDIVYPHLELLFTGACERQ